MTFSVCLDVENLQFRKQEEYRNTTNIISTLVKANKSKHPEEAAVRTCGLVVSQVSISQVRQRAHGIVACYR
jgi:hypothetical protein